MDLEGAARDRHNSLRDFHTKTTKNMKTFPYDLLYLNKERGGAGLLRFSDAVNVDKLAELVRAYRRTDEVAEAAKGVAESAARPGHR